VAVNVQDDIISVAAIELKRPGHSEYARRSRGVAAT